MFIIKSLCTKFTYIYKEKFMQTCIITPQSQIPLFLLVPLISLWRALRYSREISYNTILCNYCAKLCSQWSCLIACVQLDIWEPAQRWGPTGPWDKDQFLITGSWAELPQGCKQELCSLPASIVEQKFSCFSLSTYIRWRGTETFTGFGYTRLWLLGDASSDRGALLPLTRLKQWMAYVGRD